MKYNLFLDDERTPQKVGNYILPQSLRPMYFEEQWVRVKNYAEFVMYIMKNGIPARVSLDHDLADIHYKAAISQTTIKYREKTGYDCAKWLINYCLDNKEKLPEVFVHSMNPIGKENIEKLFDNFKKRQ